MTARARPPGRQPRGAREHPPGLPAGGRARVPTASSSTCTAPPTTPSWCATTPTARRGSRRADAGRGGAAPARGADAGRGARRVRGPPGERRDQELPAPARVRPRPTGPRTLVVALLGARGDRPCPRLVVRPRHRRPGPRGSRRRCRPPAAVIGADPPPPSTAVARARAPRAPPGRVVAARGTGGRAGGRRPRPGRRGQRVDRQRAGRAPALAVAGVDALITDVPDLALEGDSGQPAT